jgi:hypothetical protein
MISFEITDVDLFNWYKVLLLVIAWSVFLAIVFCLWGNRSISRWTYRSIFIVPMAGCWKLFGYPLGFDLFVVGGGMWWVLKPLEEFLFGKTGNVLQIREQVPGREDEHRLRPL